jgi:hypothetical protein
MQLKFSNIIWMALMLVTCSHTQDPAEENTLVKIGEFPSSMQENSGMTELNDLLWNINDGGNEPAIFGYNKTSNSLDRKVIIAGASNTDWEEITQDDLHLYIGDFGNNAGDRRNLRIYILDKAELQANTDTIPYSGLLTFSYSDQTDFSAEGVNNTAYDCEAFTVLGDSLLLFSKDWLTEQCRVYTLPAKAGDYTARFRKKFNVSGLVTGAAYNAGKKELMLLGYRNFMPFIRIVHGFELNDLNFNNSIRIDFEKFLGAQTEGIAYSADGSVYISCEHSYSDLLGITLFNPTLFRASIIMNP